MQVVLRIANGKSNVRQVRLKSNTTIGRSPDCQLKVASNQISRRHCEIVIRETAVAIKDLGSANGTFVNGRQIPADVEIPLTPGTRVALGPLQFSVEYDLPGSPARPAASEALTETSDLGESSGSFHSSSTTQPADGTRSNSLRATELDVPSTLPSQKSSPATSGMATSTASSRPTSADSRGIEGRAEKDSEKKSKRQAAETVASKSVSPTRTEAVAFGAAGDSGELPGETAANQNMFGESFLAPGAEAEQIAVSPAVNPGDLPFSVPVGGDADSPFNQFDQSDAESRPMAGESRLGSEYDSAPFDRASTISSGTTLPSSARIPNPADANKGPFAKSPDSESIFVDEEASFNFGIYAESGSGIIVDSNYTNPTNLSEPPAVEPVRPQKAEKKGFFERLGWGRKKTPAPSVTPEAASIGDSPALVSPTINAPESNSAVEEVNDSPFGTPSFVPPSVDHSTLENPAFESPTFENPESDSVSAESDDEPAAEVDAGELDSEDHVEAGAAPADDSDEDPMKNFFRQFE